MLDFEDLISYIEYPASSIKYPVSRITSWISLPREVCPVRPYYENKYDKFQICVYTLSAAHKWGSGCIL
jgi:hypothetical protein